MKNQIKKFFASFNSLIALETEEDLRHGYDFVWDKSLNNDIKDVLLRICSDTNVKFGSQNDKDNFIFALVRESLRSFVFWVNEYSDFDISTEKGKDEFYRHMMSEARSFVSDFGYDEEEQEELRARDERWENEDYISEKECLPLRSFMVDA